METNQMTPQQAIKYIIIADICHRNGADIAADMTGEMVDAVYDAAVQDGDHWDAESQAREGEVETGLDCPLSRYYVAKAVASKVPNGLWVGWTYWYGGGKHSEPEDLPWMESAYFLECAEEERMVTVRSFSRIVEAPHDS